jgi:GT2 family glycosyltransferase
MQDSKVSIVILVHNALFCVIRTLNSLRKTRGVVYETVVVDNDSRLVTKIVLLLYFVMKRINRLLFVGENTLFSKGNNLGSRISSEDSTHILLLNSDVRINHPDWLGVLLEHHEQGAISRAGLKVKAIRDYDEWITHFGGKSERVGRRVNTPSRDTVRSWFDGSGADIIDRV